MDVEWKGAGEVLQIGILAGGGEEAAVAGVGLQLQSRQVCHTSNGGAEQGRKGTGTLLQVLVETNGEGADEKAEMGSRRECIERGQIAGVRGQSEMTVEQTSRARVEACTCAGQCSEGGGREGREDGVE